MGGRGAGKTRAGAEWVRHLAENKIASRIALVAPTAADARDVMVQGESGILAISRPDFMPAYQPSIRRLTWPNGVQATCFSADEPDRLRGPQHSHAWIDEPGCLVAGTLIKTSAGDKPIEMVRPGDRVYTRCGFRRVVDAWMTNTAAEVLRVRFSNGDSLTGTGNHPLWTMNRGWARLDDLRLTDIICTWRTGKQTASYGTNVGTGSTAATTCRAMATCSIALFTEHTSARSRTDATSTTRTRTRRITLQTTWRRCRDQNIANGIGPAEQQHGRERSTRAGPRCSGLTLRLARLSAPGAGETFSARECEPSIARANVEGFTTNRWARSKSGPRGIDRKRFARSSRRYCASSAAQNSSPTVDPARVPENAATCFVVASEKLATRWPVYDLTVQGEPEFFANGILVHNSWRYGERAFDMLMFGLRLGQHPRVCATSTPRPSKLIRMLAADPNTSASRDSTHANRLHLAPSFLSEIIARYEGTRLGQQEIHAELLEISEGAWFARFDPAKHMSEAAEYDARFPVFLAIDCGVSRHVGAVFLQARQISEHKHRVTVFGDYHAEGLFSEENAKAIRARAASLPCNGRLDAVRLDPASSARTGVGPAAYGEFERVFGPRVLAALAKPPRRRRPRPARAVAGDGLPADPPTVHAGQSCDAELLAEAERRRGMA